MRINREGAVSRAIAAAGAILAALLIVASGSASAGLLIATTPDYPLKAGNLPYNVGDTIPGTLSFTNFSSTPDDGTLINVDTILFTPSCAFSSGNDGVCDTIPDGTELGVFSVTNAVGAALTSCAGRTFTVTVSDATTGELLLTPDAPFTLGSSNLNNGPVGCTINFDAKVLRVPTQDASVDAGKQTLGLARTQFSTAAGAQPSSTGTTQATIVGPSITFSKTAKATSIQQGATAEFDIVIDNSAGTGDATNVLMSDALPTALTNWVLTMVPNVSGCSITATGSPQTVSCTTLTVPAGQIQTLQLTAVTGAGALCPATMTNTAFFTGSNGVSADLSSGDTIRCQATGTDLSVTKSHGSATYTPGLGISYTIVVSNAGPANSVGASVSDTVPANITGVSASCVATGTASCGTNASSGNNVSFTGLNINAGGGNFLTITVSGTVSPAATGTLSNTVTVTPGAGQQDPNPGNNTATDSATAALSTDLAIGKSDGKTSYVPGTATSYVIVVSNLGPSNATGATVTDVVPAVITGVAASCSASGNASCGTNATSGNNVSFTGVSIAAGAGNSITITVTGNILSSATGDLVNTATVAPGAGQDDPNLANNSFTDTDTAAPNSVMSSSKTNGQTTYTPGQQTTYTIVVANNGPSDANGATVVDVKPSQITSWAWTCVEAGGASGCTPAPSNSADFSDTVNLPAGSSITYTVVAQISANATGNLVQSVTVTPLAGTPSTSTDTDAPPAPPAPVVTQIPTLGEYALIALMLMLALAGGLAVRRDRRA